MQLNVEIVSYNPEWTKLFAQEKHLLKALLPHDEVSIEHIGSTAVVNMGAKPIIDILIGLPKLTWIEARIQALADLGYHYFSQFETSFPYRRFFLKYINNTPAYHLHAVITGSDFWCRHLLFRDILRKNEALALEYLTLKQRLAKEFTDDREKYTAGKTDFINSVLLNNS